MLAPGSALSATIRAFSAGVQLRRFRRPVLDPAIVTLFVPALMTGLMTGLMTVLMTGIRVVPLHAPALLANQAANLASE